MLYEIPGDSGIWLKHIENMRGAIWHKVQKSSIRMVYSTDAQLCVRELIIRHTCKLFREYYTFMNHK